MSVSKVEATDVNLDAVAEHQNEQPTKKKPLFQINRGLIRFKLHYFLMLGGMSLVLPYAPIIGTTRIGLSGTSVGVILIFQQIATVIGNPLAGYVVDYFNKLKEILSLFMVLFIAFGFLFLVVPPINQSRNVSYTKADICPFQDSNGNITSGISPSSRHSENGADLTYGDIFALFGNVSVIQCKEDVLDDTERTGFKFSDTNVTIPRNLSLISLTNFSNEFISDGASDSSSIAKWMDFCRKINTTSIISCDYNNTQSNHSDFSTYHFWLFGSLLIIGKLCLDNVFMLSDTACCESVPKSESDYGKQRLFGPIGWMVVSLLGGLLNDYTNDFWLSFSLAGVLFAVAVWNISKMDLLKTTFTKNILRNIGSVFKSSEFLVFEAGVVMSGICLGIMFFYHSLFLLDIGSSRFLVGLVLALHGFIEIPSMFISGWLIEKCGHLNILTLTLVAYGAKFLLYSYLHNPWLVIPIEILHAISYGPASPVLASYAKKVSQPGSEATTQAVIYSAFNGVGTGIGSVVFGIGYDHLGFHRMFFWSAVFCMAGMVLLVVLSLLIHKQKKGS